MPVTFFAHQAPALPIVRRWPATCDGVALVVGTTAPDLAYAVQGSRFDVWAHGLPGLVAFGVPVSCAITWLVVRVLAPVVPSYLPDLGGFHLRDYRGLSRHRLSWWKTPLWALVGAVMHVALDHATHDWGWFAGHWAWYREPINTEPFLGRTWSPFRVMQYAGHVLLSSYSVWWLWRAGSRRWLRTRADRVPLVRSRSGAAVLAAAAALGLLVGLAWAHAAWLGWATGLMRITISLLGFLTVGAVLVGRRGVGARP